MNILVFGDSIVYGANDLEKGGWVNRLRLYLDKKYNYIFNVFNFGVSGEITIEVLNRFENECKARYNKQGNETIIIFAIGINDTQDVEGTNRVSIEQFAKNIKELIKKAKIFTDKIYFVGLTCVNEALCKNKLSKIINKYKSYLNDKIIKFDTQIEQICDDQKISYVKMFDLLNKDDLAADGLHPNANGHEKIYKRIIDTLLPNIKNN